MAAPPPWYGRISVTSCTTSGSGPSPFVGRARSASSLAALSRGTGSPDPPEGDLASPDCPASLPRTKCLMASRAARRSEGDGGPSRARRRSQRVTASRTAATTPPVASSSGATPKDSSWASGPPAATATSTTGRSRTVTTEACCRDRRRYGAGSASRTASTAAAPRVRRRPSRLPGPRHAELGDLVGPHAAPELRHLHPPRVHRDAEGRHESCDDAAADGVAVAVGGRHVHVVDGPGRRRHDARARDPVQGGQQPLDLLGEDLLGHRPAILPCGTRSLPSKGRQGGGPPEGGADEETLSAQGLHPAPLHQDLDRVHPGHLRGGVHDLPHPGQHARAPSPAGEGSREVDDRHPAVHVRVAEGGVGRDLADESPLPLLGRRTCEEGAEGGLKTGVPAARGRGPPDHDEGSHPAGGAVLDEEDLEGGGVPGAQEAHSRRRGGQHKEQDPPPYRPGSGRPAPRPPNRHRGLLPARPCVHAPRGRALLVPRIARAPPSVHRRDDGPPHKQKSIRRAPTRSLGVSLVVLTRAPRGLPPWRARSRPRRRLRAAS